MRVSRNTMRTVVPPLLALGLVAAVAVRPVTADVAGPDPSPVSAALGASAQRESTDPRTNAEGRVPVAGSMSVSVAPVETTTELDAVGGRLHAPILLTAPHVSARASIGSDPSCGVDLVQGVIGWIDCPVSSATVLVVQLSDGRVFSHAVHLP